MHFDQVFVCFRQLSPILSPSLYPCSFVFVHLPPPLLWLSVCDVGSFMECGIYILCVTSLNKTDIASPMPIVPQLGVEFHDHLISSMLGFCLAWIYVGFVHVTVFVKFYLPFCVWKALFPWSHSLSKLVLNIFLTPSPLLHKYLSLKGCNVDIPI